MRINGSVLIASVALASFAAGVAVHAWLGTEQSVELPHQRAAVAESIVEVAPLSPTFSQKGSTSALDSFFRIQSVLASTNLKSDFDQSASLYLLLMRADESELDRYINESFSISPRNQRVAALSIIFGRYAAINPNEALDRALALTQLTIPERSNVIRSIFVEWTGNDLNSVVAALDDLPEQYKYSAASAIIWRSDFLPNDQRIQLAEQIGPNDAWTHSTVTSIRAEEAKVDPRGAFYDHIGDHSHT